MSCTVLIADDNVTRKTISTPSLIKQRASNAFYQSIHFQKLSATRFLPLFNLTGIGSWSSSRTIVLLDGIPYSGYPFGIRSMDLLPVDLVTVDTIAARTGSAILPSGTDSGGSVNIRRSRIADTFTVDARFFTGSETGDPLIHIFTRPERVHYNKNKVGPSFALSIANTIGPWAYRISGGGYFYFSTGSVNEFIIGRYNPDLVPRQNRQVKVIGELMYNIDQYRSVELFMAGINLFGWEMLPFTSLFNHLTNVSSTGRLRYSDSAGGYSVTLVRDESFVWTKEMAGSLPGSIRTTEWTLYPLYILPLSDNLSLSMFSNLGVISVQDVDGDRADKQAMLLEEINRIKWGGGVEVSYSHMYLTSKAGVRIDSHFEETPNISAELLLEYRKNPGQIVHTSVSSTVYSPGYLERYGTFLTRVGADETVVDRDFRVSGNPGLQNERIHEVKLGYDHISRNVSIQAEFFGRWTGNQIIQDVERSFRPEETGEILRAATFINDGSRFVPGITLQLSAKPFSSLEISSDHQYIDNSDLRSLPRYKNINTLEFVLPLGVMLDVSVMHIGKTLWKEFILSPQDDALRGEGSTGEIESATVLDVSVGRRFERFYFAKGLEVTIQAQNLLNERFRRIPVGNFIDRAVFVYVSFGL